MNDEYTLDQCSDNRTWASNIYDINGGDNFADFCEYYFEMLDEDEYWES